MKIEELALILTGVGIAGFVGYSIASKGKPEEELKKLASNITNVPQIVTQYVEKVKEVPSIKETITKEAQSIRETYVEKIPQDFKSLYESVSKSISNIPNQFSNVVNEVNQYVEKGKQFTEGQMKKGEETLNEILRTGKEKYEEMVSNLTKPFVEKYEEAKKTLEDLKNKAVTFGTLALGVGLGYLLFRGSPVAKVVIESRSKFMAPNVLGISLPFGSQTSVM